MRASDRARTRLRQPEVAHLAGRDKLTDRASHLLDRDVRVDAVLIEEVDDIRAQPLQRRVRDLTDPLGPRVQAMVAAVSVEVETELRGDDDAIAQRPQRVPNELLVDKRPVDLGSVEERDPRRFDGIPDHADHVVPVTGVGAVTLGHAHAAEAHGGDFEALPEQSSVHLWSFAERSSVGPARGWPPRRR